MNIEFGGKVTRRKVSKFTQPPSGRLAAFLGPFGLVNALNRALKKKMERFAAELRRVVSKPGPSQPGQPPGVKTGRLRDSIKFSESKNAYTVSVGVKYAKYLEEGTTRMKARPFIGPTEAKFRSLSLRDFI